jgi:hypothetical protein
MTSDDTDTKIKSRWGRRIEVILLTVALLAIPNFLLMAFIADNIGGDAWNGYTLDGHYFVGSHGHYREVTQAVYNYSWWHKLTVMISYAAMFSFGKDESIRDRRRSPSREMLPRSTAIEPGCGHSKKAARRSERPRHHERRVGIDVKRLEREYI